MRQSTDEATRGAGGATVLPHRRTPGGGQQPSVELRVLTLVGNVVGMLEIEDFRSGLLRALHETVPADFVSFNEVGPDRESTSALAEPPIEGRLVAAFQRHAHENPILAHYQRAGTGSATRFSDVCTAEELHATHLYQEVYQPLGVEHQIAFTLPSAPSRLLGVALSRSAVDFSDVERDVLNMARPFLVQAYQNAVAHSRLLRAERSEERAERVPLSPLTKLGLSDREAEVLRLIAMGRSDRSAAEELRISPRTVQKHLERCYATLGVHSRSAAAQIVWRAVELDGAAPAGELAQLWAEPAQLARRRWSPVERAFTG
jgi:DNA-binding CsgD family transcriptional regulator